MTNTNPKTGIAYGVVALNSLAEWVTDEFMDRGVNLTSTAAFDEFTLENPDADEAAIQDFWDGYMAEEEEYELHADGMHLLLGHLGGASLVWVLESPVTTRARPCSPCVPGAGDLDNKSDGGIECYDLPADWYDKVPA